jgi:hypothetical protein
MTDTQVLIDRYFTLAATDREAHLAQFADDAVVEDEGRHYHGIEAIRAWRTSVPPVVYRVRDIRPTGAGHKVTAEISGDFPGSPVTLVFDLTFAGEKIASLTIRPR